MLKDHPSKRLSCNYLEPCSLLVWVLWIFNHKVLRWSPTMEKAYIAALEISWTFLKSGDVCRMLTPPCWHLHRHISVENHALASESAECFLQIHWSSNQLKYTWNTEQDLMTTQSLNLIGKCWDGGGRGSDVRMAAPTAEPVVRVIGAISRWLCCCQIPL